MKPAFLRSHNLLKAAGFMLAFVALFLALQPAFSDLPTGNQARDLQSARAFFRLPKDALDVLYLGNSHAMCFFSSAMLDELLGTRSYNFGSGAQNLKQIYFDLVQALEYQHPSHVVLEMSAARIDLRGKSLAQKSFQTSRYPFGWNWVQAIVAQFKPADYPAAFFPMLRNHSRWKQPADLLAAYAQLFQRDESIPDGRGWRAGEDIASMSTASGLGQPDACADVEEDLPPQNREYLDAIVALARQHDVALIFVKTPDRRKLGCRDAALEQFAELNGIPFYDYHLMEFSKTLSRVHYTDTQHANRFGVVTFNLHWAGILAKELGRSLDAQAQSRYEATAIAGLTEEHAGTQVTYTLLPATAGANLSYTWLAELNGKQVARSADGSTSNSFTLDLSAEGTYRISVRVGDATRPDNALTGLIKRRTRQK
jgi:hypothetical protein